MNESGPAAGTRGRRKSLLGVVVSNKMDKTVVVSVERRQRHSLYRKIIRSTKHYKAHDPNNAAVLGDTVRIEETRPISKDKRWRIAETLTRGNVAEVAPREIGMPEEPEEAPSTATVRPVTRRRAAAVTAAAEPQAAESPVEEASADVAAEPQAAESPVEEASADVAAEPQAAEPPAEEASAGEGEASGEKEA